MAQKNNPNISLNEELNLYFDEISDLNKVGYPKGSEIFKYVSEAIECGEFSRLQVFFPEEYKEYDRRNESVIYLVLRVLFAANCFAKTSPEYWDSDYDSNYPSSEDFYAVKAWILHFLATNAEMQDLMQGHEIYMYNYDYIIYFNMKGYGQISFHNPFDIYGTFEILPYRNIGWIEKVNPYFPNGKPIISTVYEYGRGGWVGKNIEICPTRLDFYIHMGLKKETLESLYLNNKAGLLEPAIHLSKFFK